MEDHDINDDIDYEIEEDDWAMDPDIDNRLQTCIECQEAAKRCMAEDIRWEIASIVRRFVEQADSLQLEEYYLDQLYDIGSELDDMLYDHPRLSLQLAEMMRSIEMRIQIRDLGEPCPDSEWKDTILYLKQNINWADQGLLDKIVDRRPLKHDPVEWTRQWEEVIDEVEQKTYKKLKGEPRGMGFCFSYWPALHSALLKYGIEWRNPRQMNPRVIFD